MTFNEQLYREVQEQVSLGRAGDLSDIAGAHDSQIDMNSVFNGKTVVLLEDNPQLKDLDTLLAEGYGFKVEAFPRGNLVANYVQNGGRADLYVLDGETPDNFGDAPKMNFNYVAGKIREYHPDARIVVKSGQNVEPIARPLNIKVMHKPNTITSSLREYFPEIFSNS